MKYIVIDGVKYVIDPNDSTKALLDANGEMVKYVEEVPPADVNSHEYKMKNDPEYARIIARNQQLEDEKRLADEAKQKEHDENLKKNGEWQKLAEEAETRRLAAEERARESEAVLGKYKGTLNSLVDDMIAQVPEDKRSLIPDGNAHKKVEYLKKNAKFLGISLMNSGSGVPPNDGTPPLDEEGKLQKEFSDLVKKENLTHTEKQRMSDVSRLLKEMRARKS